jgi:hypothetical protein
MINVPFLRQIKGPNLDSYDNMETLKYSFVLFILTFCSLSHSEMRTSLEASSLSFISPDYVNDENKNFGFIGATLLSNPKKSDIVMLNLTGLYAIGHPSLSYLNFREAYFSYQIDDNSQLDVGRKLSNWSSLDSEWNIGFFQPQFRWNSIHPENQGLTGLFWQRKENLWQFGLFASPLFIPDQGPGYELKDGQFVDSNPWFQPPPQNILFQGNILLPIDYQINRPENSDVIFQTMYGAQLHLGDKEGFFAHLAGIYKPANQLALGYKVATVVTRVRIEILPKVYYENDFAADFGYRDNWGNAMLSFLYAKPKTPEFEPGYNAPEFEESLSWGPSTRFDFKPFRVGVAYLDTVGGSVKETGPYATPSRAALSQRFLFRQAYQVKLAYTDIFSKKVKIESSLQYRESTKEPYKQIDFNNRLDLRGPWAFWGNLILIETSDDSNSNMDAYRHLDQITIGASYDI